MVTIPDDMAQSVSTALLITAMRAQREAWDRALSPTVRAQRQTYAAYLDAIRAHLEEQLAPQPT